MSHSKYNSIKQGSQGSVQGSVPVMPCHPAEGDGTSGQLVRGATPSTPRQGRQEKRRMSIKKFFRCTPEEDAFITAQANKAGLEPSSYMRVQILGKSKVRKVYRVRADWKELQRCMGIINKAGNVVNQLVVTLRRMEVNPFLANTALHELCEAARTIVKAIRDL